MGVRQPSTVLSEEPSVTWDSACHAASVSSSTVRLLVRKTRSQVHTSHTGRHPTFLPVSTSLTLGHTCPSGPPLSRSHRPAGWYLRPWGLSEDKTQVAMATGVRGAFLVVFVLISIPQTSQ